MSDLKMGTAEARFADIIWEREPITSGQMAKIGAEEFNWKKTLLTRFCAVCVSEACLRMKMAQSLR